ncbi:MAG: DNA alkylation repair protein [Planctomycetes bacterium]|nr:DNA alkylation repair protein [Planctomycetota bacterium]
MSEKALEEITKRLLPMARNPRDDEVGDFRRMTIPVPEVRAEFRNGYSFRNLPPAKLLETWDYVWKNAGWYEVMSTALYHFQGRSIAKNEVAKLKTWVDRVHCWEHSDDLSKILAGVVEENPGWILPTLETWNKAKNPWKRRQSVVALLEYSSKRKRVQPFERLIAFVSNLLGDEEYYVQKGVGWTIREIYNLYPTETFAFIEDRIHQISPHAWSAATEKLPKSSKSMLGAERKRGRKSSENSARS